MLAIALGMMLFVAQAPQSTSAEEVSAAPTESAKPSTTLEKTQADPGRLVCRREAKANSRFTTKICKTAEEWDQRADTASEAFGDVQNRPTISIAKGS